MTRHDLADELWKELSASRPNKTPTQWDAAEQIRHAGLTAAEDAKRKPRLTATVDGDRVSIKDRCALAEGMLRTMSLTRDFARVVTLLGLGSQTRNNPHGAGLDCGACGGQTGEVNARVAAALLNEPEVRAGLSARGRRSPRRLRRQWRRPAYWPSHAVAS